MDFLTQKSLELLLSCQSPEGAFYACPNFDTYRYSWFRDGSFCALALAEFGYHREAWKFFEWGAQVVLRYQEKILSSIETVNSGQELVAAESFHSRFTVEGAEVPGNWGHNQLDGLGTWLWALGQFRHRHNSLPLSEEVTLASGLAKDYLAALWKKPCSDCWEEHEDMLHTYTLAAVSAGLRGYAELFADPRAADCAAEIRAFILHNCVYEGIFVKSISIDSRKDNLNGDGSKTGASTLKGVDANLIGLCTPYQLVEWEHPVFQNTLSKIEQDLLTPGLHRYRGDTYYGSGEWILLTDWLGWAYAQAGEHEKAAAILNWTWQQATEEGNLPEQVPHALFDPDSYPLWVKRWGPIATPLMWSHAQYLLLVKSIEIGGK